LEEQRHSSRLTPSARWIASFDALSHPSTIERGRELRLAEGLLRYALSFFRSGGLGSEDRALDHADAIETE